MKDDKEFMDYISILEAPEKTFYLEDKNLFIKTSEDLLYQTDEKIIFRLEISDDENKLRWISGNGVVKWIAPHGIGIEILELQGLHTQRKPVLGNPLMP